MPPFDSQQFQNPSSTGYYAPNQQQGMIGAALQDQFTSIMRSFKDELSFNMQTLNLTLSSLSSSMQNLSGKIGGLGPNTAGRYIDGGLNSGAFLGNISREFANYQPLSTTSFGLGIINSTRVRHPFNVSPLEYYMGSDIKRGMMGSTLFGDLAQSALRAIPGAIETSGMLAGMAGSFLGPVGMVLGGAASLAAPYLADAVRMGSNAFTDNTMLIQRMSGRFSGIPLNRAQAFTASKGIQDLMYQEIQNTTSMDTRLGFSGFRDVLMLGLQGDMFKGNSPEGLVKQVKEASKVVKVFTEIMGSKDVKETMEALVQMKNMGVNFSMPGSSNFANNLVSSAAAFGFNNSMSGSQMLKAGMQIAQSGYGTYGIPSGLGIGTAMQELATVTEMRKRGALSDVQIAMGGGTNAIASRILGAQGNFLQSGFGTLALMNQLTGSATGALTSGGFWGAANRGLNTYFSGGLGGIANFEANKTELMALLTQDNPNWLDDTWIQHLRSSAHLMPGYAGGSFSSRMDLMKLRLMSDYGLDAGAAEKAMQSVMSDFNKYQTLNAEYATSNSQVGSQLRAKNTLTARYFGAGPESFEKYITKKIHKPVSEYAQEWAERWSGIRKNYYDDGGNAEYFNDDTYTKWEKDASGTRKIGELDEVSLVNDIVSKQSRWEGNISIRDTNNNTRRRYINAMSSIRNQIDKETDPKKISDLKKQLNVLSEKIEGINTLEGAAVRQAMELIGGDKSIASAFSALGDAVFNQFDVDNRNSTLDLTMSSFYSDFIKNRAETYKKVRTGGSGLNLYDARDKLIAGGFIGKDSVYTSDAFAVNFKESILRNANNPVEAALDWLKYGKGEKFENARGLFSVSENDLGRKYFSGYIGNTQNAIDIAHLEKGMQDQVKRLTEAMTDGTGGKRIREIFNSISASLTPQDAQRVLRYAFSNANFSENKRFSDDEDLFALAAYANMGENDLNDVMDAWGNSTTAKALNEFATSKIFDGSKIKTRETVEKYWRKLGMTAESGIKNPAALLKGLNDEQLKELFEDATRITNRQTFREKYKEKYKGMKDEMFDLIFNGARQSNLDEFRSMLGGSEFFTIDENLKKFYGVQFAAGGKFSDAALERLKADPKKLYEIGFEENAIIGANKETDEKLQQAYAIKAGLKGISGDRDAYIKTLTGNINGLYGTTFTEASIKSLIKDGGNIPDTAALLKLVGVETAAGRAIESNAAPEGSKNKWKSRIDAAVRDTEYGLALAVKDVRAIGAIEIRDQVDKRTVKPDTTIKEEKKEEGTWVDKLHKPIFG